MLIAAVILIVWFALLTLVCLFFAGVKTADDWYCPVGSTDEPDMHCQCWYDGEGCCRCHAPAMTWDEAFKDNGEVA